MSQRGLQLASRLLEDGYDLDDLDAQDVLDVLSADADARRAELRRTGVVNAETADLATEWYHRKQRTKKGEPLRVRRNGRTKRWKRHPDQFRIPVKYGLYDYFYIDNSNAHEWSTVPNPEPEK